MYSRSAAIFTYETALSTLRGNATPPILNSAVQVTKHGILCFVKKKKYGYAPNSAVQVVLAELKALLQTNHQMLVAIFVTILLYASTDCL